MKRVQRISFMKLTFKKIRSLAGAAASKLRSGSGESIAEVLVALLISAAALVMLASMITASTSMIRAGDERLKDYYDANELLSKADGAPDHTGTAVLSSGTDGFSQEFSVDYYVNDDAPKGDVIAYRLS